MDKRRLNKLRAKIENLREKGGIKSSELESLAEALGRIQTKRGKEPTWVNPNFTDLRPLSIPRHGSRDLNKFTANTILDQLELDVDKFEELIDE